VETSIPLSVATSTRADPDANEEATKAKTRPLRFVPHESASSASSIDKQEQTALEKFRAAAQASLAVVQPRGAHDPEEAGAAPEPAKTPEANGSPEPEGAPSSSGEE